jgi:hypothetical protein
VASSSAPADGSATSAASDVIWNCPPRLRALRFRTWSMISVRITRAA